MASPITSPSRRPEAGTNAAVKAGLTIAQSVARREKRQSPVIPRGQAGSGRGKGRQPGPRQRTIAGDRP